MEKIRLQIGDFSGDGHGQKETFYFCLADPFTVLDAREAFFNGKEDKILSKFAPDLYCKKYMDGMIPLELFNEIIKFDPNFPIKLPYDFEPELDKNLELYPEDMADWMVWFLNKSNPSLQASIVNDDIIDFHFYGFDSKNRHINFIGYGLFEFKT